MNTVAIKRKHVNQLRKTKQKTRRSSVKVDTTSKERENFIKKKIRKLNDALESDPVDVDLLRKLMLSKEGCITEDIRCKVWPKLLNVNLFEYPRKKNADVELKEFQDNKWWRQVNLDVNRSHRRFPLETRLSRKRILQHQLTNIIMRVLCRNSHLHYYQGYHDIAVTLLRVVGEDVATLLLDKLSNTHIIDFMDTNMNRTSRMLSFFYAVMGKEDPTLEQFLLKSEVGTLFAVSWLITWFGHDINGFDLVVRLFDVFLASHPIMPVYFSVALVIVHRQQVLERDCDMAMVYHCLSRLPSYIGVDDIEKLITYAYELYVKHPPDSLKREVRKYLRESDSIVHHTELVYQSYNQRPDSVLRRRKKYGRFFTDSSKSVNAAALSTADTVLAKHSQNVNPLVKAAVWTMTLSMGVMTFLVLNTTKHWL